MPESLLFIIITVIALLGMVVMSWGVTIGPRPIRPDPLEESAAAQRAAITAADTARASARAARAAELAEFDAEARRILDALDAPCVCSQVSTHEWDEHTQSYRQRWTVPEHFPSCAKHWPDTTGAPPAGTIAELERERSSLTAAHLQRQGGPMLTPAARVDAERARYVAEAWARHVTDPEPLPWADHGDHTATSGPTAELRATLGRLAELQTETRRTPGGVPYRAPAAITTYGVPADCTCVPDHTRELLTENTRVVHRADCATNRGPRGADRRWMSDNG